MRSSPVKSYEDAVVLGALAGSRHLLYTGYIYPAAFIVLFLL